MAFSWTTLAPTTRRWAAAGIGAAVVGWMGLGFTAGAWLAPHAPGTPTALTTTGAGTATATASATPWTVGHVAPWSANLTTLTGQSTHLARGAHGTIVMAMASWCLFCGYEDRWVWPKLAQAHPHWAIDIVDVSPQGGIADPGPQNPPFHGHDGVGGALTVSGMQTTMRQYVSTYGLHAPNIHVYVAPTATQSAWAVQSFPDIFVINAAGQVVHQSPGAITASGGPALLATATAGQ